MKYDFLDWEGVLELWKQIKAVFLAKDTDGNVSVPGGLTVNDHATIQGSIKADGGMTSDDIITLKAGSALEMYNEDNDKKSSFRCDDSGKMLLNDVAVATVTDVSSAVSNLASKTEVNTTVSNAVANLATKTEVASAVANAGHLKREKVSALPGIATAKENVIYMVTNSTTGDNKFDEYMLIDGSWEKTGSSDVDLSGYSTTEQMNTAISTAIESSHTPITKEQIRSLS